MMKRILTLAVAALFVQSCSTETETSQVNEKILTPPIAKKIPHKMEIHGDVRIDDYYWMRDDTRTDPEILAHLQAEEDYAQQQMAHTKDFQKTLYEEMIGRLKKDDTSVPFIDNGYSYQSKFIPGSEYPVYVRTKDEAGAKEEVLLDVNKMAEGLEYYAVGDWSITANNKIIGYSEDTLSRRVYTIKFKNLETGEMLADQITGTNGQVIWANDSKSMYYLAKDPQTLLGYQVYRHVLGTDQSSDELMYEETDNSFYTYLYKTLDSQYVGIYHSSTVSLGVSMLDANDASAKFSLAHPIEADLEYEAYPYGDEFYIKTNYKAANYRIVKASKETLADKDKWQDVVAHSDDTFISGILVLKDKLVYTMRTKGLMSMAMLDYKSGQAETVQFDESLYSVDFEKNVDFNAKQVRVSYVSMTTPSSVFDINLADMSKTLLKQVEVVGGYDASQYTSKRIMVKSRDGVDIPVSILYKNDSFKQDGTNPVLQYAYGSYGSTNDPYFASHLLSLIDRGFVYVHAHIRGSQMLGRKWYDDGKLLNKINTFNDFVDVSRFLVAEKYVHQDKLFAYGGSAGGLLMGAIINQSPELYRGVIAAVPFVDVVTTMLDESIPLTTNEFDEWGNPKEKKYYDYMLSYSPYDQVEAKDYPNLLVTTGLHDSQVQYFEPMKWVAKLRDMKTDDNELMFHVNMGAGHGGASGRYKRYIDRAFTYAFMFDLLEQAKE